MTCVFYLPQIQTMTGQWVDVGQASESKQEVEQKRAEYENNSRVKAFRIVQTTCKDKVIRRACCGG